MIQGYDLKTLAHKLEQSIPKVGFSQRYHGAVAPDGWLLENGDTIGDTGSSATHEGATYRSLYDHLWDMIKNYSAGYTISAAIGTTSSADWSAGVTIAIPDSQGVGSRGIGTQTINGRTKTGPTNIGDIQEDQEQGHDHSLTENVFGTLVGNTFNSVFPTGNAGYNSPVKASTMINNGADGTPRKGTETHDNSIGVNYIIKL